VSSEFKEVAKNEKGCIGGILILAEFEGTSRGVQEIHGETRRNSVVVPVDAVQCSRAVALRLFPDFPAGG
jgi:hypothetical protein